MLGNAVAPIALAFAVLDLTGSATDVGVVVAARSVANVALLLVGGVLADRFPRTLMLVGSALAAAVTQAAVAGLVLTGQATIPLLVGLSVANGALAAIAFPASAAVTPQTVPSTLLQSANAMLRLGISASGVVGAAVGGVLVAVVGPGWGIAADAATFAVAGLMFVRVRVERGQAVDKGGGVWTDLRTGWSEFTARRWVWVVVAQFGVVNAALAGTNTVLGPTIADESFGRSTWGLLLAAQMAGLVAGGLIALRLRPARPLRAGVVCTFAVAVPMLCLALGAPVVVLFGAFLAAGLAVEQLGVAWDVSLQENISEDRLARVYSYDALGSYVAVPVGQVLVGPLAGTLGLRPTLLGSAAAVIVATLLSLSSRSVRSLTRVPDIRPAEATDARTPGRGASPAR